MVLTVERVDVWAAGIEDEPGGLSRILLGLKEAGADLDFIVARRAPEEPGKAVAFVTPLRGDKEVAAATELGFNVTQSINAIRVAGPNEAGVAADLTQKLADANINLRGLSAAVIGSSFIVYIGFDSVADAEKAAGILKQA